VEFQKIHGLKAKKDERRQRLLNAERHLRAAPGDPRATAPCR
jgi:hypothetical protein